VRNSFILGFSDKLRNRAVGELEQTGEQIGEVGGGGGVGGCGSEAGRGAQCQRRHKQK